MPATHHPAFVIHLQGFVSEELPVDVLPQLKKSGEVKHILAYRAASGKNHVFVRYSNVSQAIQARGQYSGAWQADPLPSELIPTYHKLRNRGQYYEWDGTSAIIPRAFPESTRPSSAPSVSGRSAGQDDVAVANDNGQSNWSFVTNGGKTTHMVSRKAFLSTHRSSAHRSASIGTDSLANADTAQGELNSKEDPSGSTAHRDPHSRGRRLRSQSADSVGDQDGGRDGQPASSRTAYRRSHVGPHGSHSKLRKSAGGKWLKNFELELLALEARRESHSSETQPKSPRRRASSVMISGPIPLDNPSAVQPVSSVPADLPKPPPSPICIPLMSALPGLAHTIKQDGFGDPCQTSNRGEYSPYQGVKEGNGEEGRDDNQSKRLSSTSDNRESDYDRSRKRKRDGSLHGDSKHVHKSDSRHQRSTSRSEHDHRSRRERSRSRSPGKRNHGRMASEVISSPPPTNPASTRSRSPPREPRSHREAKERGIPFRTSPALHSNRHSTSSEPSVRSLFASNRESISVDRPRTRREDKADELRAIPLQQSLPIAPRRDVECDTSPGTVVGQKSGVALIPQLVSTSGATEGTKELSCHDVRVNSGHAKTTAAQRFPFLPPKPITTLTGQTPVINEVTALTSLDSASKKHDTDSCYGSPLLSHLPFLPPKPPNFGGQTSLIDRATLSTAVERALKKYDVGSSPPLSDTQTDRTLSSLAGQTSDMTLSYDTVQALHPRQADDLLPEAENLNVIRRSEGLKGQQDTGLLARILQSPSTQMSPSSLPFWLPMLGSLEGSDYNAGPDGPPPSTSTNRVSSMAEYHVQQIARLRELYRASQQELVIERAAKRRAEDEADRERTLRRKLEDDLWAISLHMKEKV